MTGKATGLARMARSWAGRMQAGVRRGHRRVAAVVAATMLLTVGLLAGGATSASAVDGRPCARPQVFRAGHWVQYCPLWRGNVPVYASPDRGNGAPVVGRLVVGGSANWFVGDRWHSNYTLGSYHNHWWAYTLADNGHWGWVPEVYFSGGANDDSDAGLYVCNFGPRTNLC